MTTPVRTVRLVELGEDVRLRHPLQSVPSHEPLFAFTLAEPPTRYPDPPHLFPWPAPPKRAKWSWLFTCGCRGVALDDYRVGLVASCHVHAVTPTRRDPLACPNCATGRLVSDPRGRHCGACGFETMRGRLD